MFARIRSNWLIPALVAVGLLTLLAAHFQYRWVNRVSEADNRQRRDSAATTLRNFSVEFRETILRPAMFFRFPAVASRESEIEPALLEVIRSWRNTADRPRLINSISIGRQGDTGIAFKRLSLGDDQFKVGPWPDRFAPYRAALEQHVRPPGGAPPLFPRGFGLEFIEGMPVLVVPLVAGEPQRGGEGRDREPRQFPPELNNATTSERPAFPHPGPPDFLRPLGPGPGGGAGQGPELKGWYFLELDANYLREQLLPELVARYYGSEAHADYYVAVVSGQPLTILYRSDSGVTAELLAQVDAGIVLLEGNMQPGRPGPPLPPPAEGSPGNGRRPRPPPAPPQPLVSGPGGAAITQLRPERGRGARDDEAWLLVVKNKAGSLESMVEHSRRHNVGVSLVILLALAGSLVMLMLATTRARSLARQQMEFVAGVSHELRTPLTVIQSTSYNLSQGMIQDPNRVRQYGQVIQNEARRLINQVERMLSFAGIQAGRIIYDPQPTNAVQAIERALAEYETALSSAGWQVEREIAGNLPLVVTDGPALESALKNLFENALKYAAAGKWLKVSAKTRKKGGNEGHRGEKSEVLISVADHGPGIAPGDLPHIFEPFYRGQDAIASSISGAGLGLCLIERQMTALGGSVTVKSETQYRTGTGSDRSRGSTSQSGTCFTLHLPVEELRPQTERNL